MIDKKDPYIKKITIFNKITLVNTYSLLNPTFINYEKLIKL